MQASNAPTRIQTPFANSGDKQTIPVASQIGVADGRASFTDGFPPLTRTPIVAGGVPPFGTDMNGILYALSLIQQWQSAGGLFKFDSAFAAAIGGYPRGAMIQRADGSGFWLCTTDNNTANPDTGGAGWSAFSSGGVVGNSRAMRMVVASASASGTLTADEIVVGASLGGQTYRLPSFSKTINLATTGAGGMDTGAAPNNGAVAIYAIYNPTTGASALLAVNATSAAAPNIYGGANMPSGYTASALVSVWRTNASGQFVVGYQYERRVSLTAALAFSATATAASPTSVSLAPILPPNAVEAYGTISAGVTGAAASSISSSIGSSAAMVGSQSVNSNANGIVSVYNQFNVQISASQTIFYQFTQTGGTSPSVNIFLVGYSF